MEPILAEMLLSFGVPLGIAAYEIWRLRREKRHRHRTSGESPRADERESDTVGPLAIRSVETRDPER